jgi:ribosomal protein S12
LDAATAVKLAGVLGATVSAANSGELEKANSAVRKLFRITLWRIKSVNVFIYEPLPVSLLSTSSQSTCIC